MGFHVSQRQDRSLLIVLVGTVVVFFIFTVFYGLTVLLDFIVTWGAGLLGILTGFAMDRMIEQTKEEQVKKDFLTLIHDELVEIKGKIPPQTQTPYMLYPEIWDSFVSSGLIRLLSSEQVKKLSSVYKFIKGTQYEAEWVRRAVEDVEREHKASSLERYKSLQVAYFERGTQLSQEIEKLLKEKWWT
jgi:hypothetical protein